MAQLVYALADQFCAINDLYIAGMSANTVTYFLFPKVKVEVGGALFNQKEQKNIPGSEIICLSRLKSRSFHFVNYYTIAVHQQQGIVVSIYYQ